jgi:Protein of unknown function (DUF4238)
MAKDHFIPRAYLRGFTHEYLTGQKGGKLVVYNPSSGNSGSVSINEHVACEPEFYNGHPLDKKWSETIERTWGNVRDRLKAGENTHELLDQLFWFFSAQFIRTPLIYESRRAPDCLGRAKEIAGNSRRPRSERNYHGRSKYNERHGSSPNFLANCQRRLGNGLCVDCLSQPFRAALLNQ